MKFKHFTGGSGDDSQFFFHLNGWWKIDGCLINILLDLLLCLVLANAYNATKRFRRLNTAKKRSSAPISADNCGGLKTRH